MGSDGYLSVFTLPDLKLVYKEDCVDAADAIGQRNFTMARNGTLLHQRSPSEFTRGSITEDARLEFHFSLSTKHVSPLMLTPNTPTANREPIFEVTHVSILCVYSSHVWDRQQHCVIKKRWPANTGRNTCYGDFKANKQGCIIDRGWPASQ